MRRLWAERTPAFSWGGGAVSLAATAASFLVAFVAMTTVRATFRVPATSQVQRASIVFLEPPRTPTPPQPRQVLRNRRPVVDASPTPERVEAPSASADTRTPIDTAPRDSAKASPARVIALPLIPIVPLRPLAEGASDSGGRGGRSSLGPAGVIAHESSISAAARDSIASSVMLGIPKLARERKATPDEVDRLRRQRDPGLAATGRAARLPGEAVYAPTMGGNVSVAVPILSFSVGRSHRDRARDSAIHADNMARLRRLQDLAIWRRDSIRLDSLRRDSLARAGRSPTNPQRLKTPLNSRRTSPHGSQFLLGTHAKRARWNAGPVSGPVWIQGVTVIEPLPELPKKMLSPGNSARRV
jgi:hypothetical protein